MKAGRFPIFLLLLVALTARADAPGVYALRNGIVHPVSGAEIPGGVVVIRGGLIEAAGANVPIPRDATEIDLSGAHVYPGLIDAWTSLGFGASASGKTVEPTAASVAAETISLTLDDLDARRITGVTTVISAPAAGILSGQSVVLNLSDDPTASRIVKTPAAMNAAFRMRPNWTYPDSLMGVIAYLRQTFYDAQHHAAAGAAYGRNPAQKRPASDASLDALQPVIRRELPIVIAADSPEMIRRAQALAREFNLRLIIAGARQAYSSPLDLKGTPVLVSVDWPRAPTDREDREEQPLRVIRDRVLGPSTPAALAREGIPFALVSGSATAAEFIPGIRKAIANGLSPDEALRAVTLAPARIFGVDRQLGSLEPGKIANIVVTDRPLFDKKAKVTRLFVDGREIRPQPAKETGTTSPVDGTWNLSVRAPEGNVSIVVVLRARSGHVSGTFSGDRGSGDLAGGLYDPPTLQFTIVATMEAETGDWVFRGTIVDDTIEGTVTTSLGTFQFTGSRSR